MQLIAWGLILPGRVNSKPIACQHDALHAAGTRPLGRAAIVAATLLVMALLPVASRAAPDAKTAASTDEKPSRPVLPKPFSPSKEELDHIKSFDQAIAPLMATTISAEDQARLRDAVKAITTRSPTKADELKAQISDATARKIVDWYRLGAGYGTADSYRAFLDANPAWPDRQLLTQRLEEALFTEGGSSASIRAHFNGQGPDFGAGFAALASAYLAEGKEAEARKYAARAWREFNIPATLEAGFLDRFGRLLAEADHKWRLDRLLIDEIRWTGQRNERAAFVRRLIPLLSRREQAKAQARLKVFQQQDGGRAAIDALPADAKPDWGLDFHRIQALRRANRINESAKLMLSVPTDPAVVANLDEWWVERRANAYASLRIGNPKLAYELVRNAGPLTVNPLKDQTFIAGWLALRYLKDASAAEKHFQAMSKAADGPLSRAKANYWLGRTAEARKDEASAQKFYAEAAKDPDTFHGLLAMQKLSPGRQPLPIGPPALPTPVELARFQNLDAVRAVVIASKSGLDRNVTRSFVGQLRFSLKSEAEAALIAHLSEAIGDTQMAVRTAKAGVGSRQNLLYYAYPVHPFPAYTPLRMPPESAFLLGIARQETEFNTQTVSGAGAKGLLQVMTVTAEHVCRDYKIKCEIKRLLTDPAYNTMMASAYIADRMDGFAGSYVLGLAGYNAGPGRAREWIREFGDPRDPKVDPLDWIERIPFQETREYVAKVLANVQVYRARLGEQKPLRLDEDLNRARGVRTTPSAAPDDGEAAGGATVGTDG